MEAIANFLIANPQATVKFQYPTPLSSSHPDFNKDLKAVYNMSFQQISNFLKQKGVENLNKRVLMIYGKKFGIVVKR